MTWSESLPIEILELFASLGQNPDIKIAEWLAFKFGDKNARRRAKYAIDKYMATKEFKTMLAEQNRRSKAWRTSNREKYLKQKRAIRDDKLVRRAERVRGRYCEECGIPLAPLDRKEGQLLRFCSKTCCHRYTGRMWFRRKHPEQRILKRSYGEMLRLGLLPIDGPFFVTPHAVQRYQERIHRGIGYDSALREIIDHSKTAHYVKNYAGQGEYWRCAAPTRLRLIVSRERPGLPQIVTILPASEAVR